MKLSILILTWNAKGHLLRCLDSLKACTVPDWEIIVVDNGSTDGTVEYLEALQRAGEIRVVFNGRNLGVGPARNEGFKVARGQYILSLDVDTEVQPGAIEHLVAVMDKHGDVGLCAARLHGPDGELQHTCRHFPTLQSKLFRQLPGPLRSALLQEDELLDWDHRGLRYVGYVIGACQMIRHTALAHVGAYDPAIFYGPEDVDICLRMWQAGWKVLYDGDAVIIHHERRITKNWRRLFSRTTRAHMKSLVYYFLKHRYLFRVPVVPVAGPGR